MKMHRPAEDWSPEKNLRRERAEQEAIRLMRNKDDMFEKYLKKPATTSVGFLVLDKINSASSRRKMSKQHEKSSAKSFNRPLAYRDSQSKRRGDLLTGGGVVYSVNKSPILSSQNDFKDHDGESFAVSVVQTTFDVDPSQLDVQLRQKKFDTLSNENMSFNGNISGLGIHNS